MMTFRGKRRVRGRNFKSAVPNQEENYGQDNETRRGNDVIPSLLEKLESLENEILLKDNKLLSLDETVKCLQKQLEVKDNKCAPIFEEEKPCYSELVNIYKTESTNEYMCHEKELEDKELRTAKMKINCLENEIKLSSEKLKTASEKIDHLEQNLELKNIKLNSAIEEIKYFKKQLKLKTSELISTVDENKCLEIELEVKNSSIESTNEKINCLEKENREKNAEFESMKEKITALKQQLEQKDKDLDSIREDIKYVKSCYAKVAAKKDQVIDIESDECSDFIPDEDRLAQILGNYYTCSSCYKTSCFSTAETQTVATEFDHNEITEGLKVPEVSKETVPDVRRQTDEAIASDPDYIYIESLRVYYSSSTGYYYDPDTGINTDSLTGRKYVYCPATQTYRFFMPRTISPEILIKHLEEQMEYKKRKISMPDKPSKVLKSEENDVDMEEFDSTDDESKENCTIESEDIKNSHIIESQFVEYSLLSTTTQNVKSLPPSIRCIVLESEILQKGSLLLVTYTGVTIGRDMNCTMCIPDNNVSKIHAKIDFDISANCYVITDLGSENGTFLNDHRLSEPREQSEPYPLNHEDSVCIANCKLLMHIHNGKETCNNCEPGQVHADLTSKLINKNSEITILSKEEKEKERRKELNKLKKRFALNTAYSEVEKLSDIENLGYKDLAKERQKTKGSDNPYEKTEVQSLEHSLTAKNKGFKLLQKMGWKEGEGLGKTSSGQVEPVPIPSAVPSTSIKKKPVMSKAAMRYFQREISLRSGNTKQQSSINQSKMPENIFTPVNFVAETRTQIGEQEILRVPEFIHEPDDTKPPINFLSKLVEKEPEINVSIPTMPPTDFLSKLVEKQPEDNVAASSSLSSTESKEVEQQSEINEASASTLPPTDFLSKLVQRKPKQKRRCREMIDGYVDPSNHS